MVNKDLNDDKFKITLTENGRHSYQKGIQALDTYMHKNNHMILKEAILFIHHGVELLMKQILVDRSDFLIFEDMRDVTKKQQQADKLEVGIFELSNPPKTISYSEAINRVKAFVHPLELDENLMQNLDKLNQARNQIEHYAIEVDAQDIIHLLSNIREPLNNLFASNIRGMKSLISKPVQLALDDLAKVEAFYSDAEERVFRVLKKFCGQTLSGSLFSYDNDIVLPKFDEILHGYFVEDQEGLSRLTYEADFFCVSNQGNWVIEVKGSMSQERLLNTNYSNRLIRSLTAYKRIYKAKPWLVIFSYSKEFSDQFSQITKAHNFLFSNANQFDELEHVIL